jgi:DNA polymerase-3 subunit epsilon
MLRLSIARLRNRWIRNRLRGKELASPAYENLSALDHIDLNQKAKEMRYVILDLETTGLDLSRDEVVSLSAVSLVDGRILLGDVFNSLVNPGREIPSATIKIHGIVPSMVDQAPTFDEVFDQFLRYLGTGILVGYHVGFDLNFLNNSMKRKYGIHLQNMVLDVMYMCNKVIFPAHIRNYALRLKRNQGLDAMAEYFGIQIPERHTSFGDALATAMIFQRILAELEKRGPATLRRLLHTGSVH